MGGQNRDQASDMRWGGSVDIVAPIAFIVKLTPW